ncbi:MAG: peptidylprolyl isomerase, partial [Bacteroidota bacterium]
LNKESQLNVNTKTSKFVKGENDIIDGIEWKVGITPNANKNSSVVFVHVMEVLEPMPKNIDEAKGVITADYQSQLEKMWIDELRAKYPYKVNNEVLDSFSGK